MATSEDPVLELGRLATSARGGQNMPLPSQSFREYDLLFLYYFFSQVMGVIEGLEAILNLHCALSRVCVFVTFLVTKGLKPHWTQDCNSLIYIHFLTKEQKVLILVACQ